MTFRNFSGKRKKRFIIIIIIVFVCFFRKIEKQKKLVRLGKVIDKLLWQHVLPASIVGSSCYGDEIHAANIVISKISINFFGTVISVNYWIVLSQQFNMKCGVFRLIQILYPFKFNYFRSKYEFFIWKIVNPYAK